MKFVVRCGDPLPLHMEDVHAARAELETRGVTFFGYAFDTGVYHMAIFADPDGDHLMLHHRYARTETRNRRRRAQSKERSPGSPGATSGS